MTEEAQGSDKEAVKVSTGRLDRLELENFKSYGGRVVVGPFKGFNAVIGTNGSGKSNLMDAISFVLGVRTTQLRGNQLRDLVYRNLADPRDDPRDRKATVKLIFDKGGKKYIEFSRTVTLSGASEYRVDNKVLSLEKYNLELAKIGILVKARNFLVFQNEVEGIASKSPRELTTMFEEVSTSAEYRDEYNRARVEKDAAEEQVTHFWRKRKGMAAEKRQYKEQKEEADKFQRLQEELGRVKTLKAMFQLFHLDKDINTTKLDINDAEKELVSHENELEREQSSLSGVKEEVAALEKRRLQQERKLRRIQDEIDKMRPTEVKYQTEKTSLQRRIKGDERSLEKAKEKADSRAGTVAGLQRELTTVEKQIADIQNEIKAAEESHVSAASMTEYRSLKEIAATRTSALQQAATVAQQSRSSAAKQKDATEARHAELQRRHQSAVNDASTFRRRAADLRRQAQDARSEREALSAERARLEEVGGEKDQVRAELEKAVSQTTQALRDAKADLNESSRERAFNNALESMQRLFPGVRGRLSDLCKPTQPRYREAIAVVFGKLMNAIVVDNERTGSDCISFLKDKRAGMATFIPLQDIRPRPVDESLRRLGGTARLVVDVVDHHESIQKAVLYASGNAVVCDTLGEARHLRYEQGHKIKICSLDGTLINKAGFMTGGTSRATRDRAMQWDRSEIDALKRKRAKAQEELSAIGAATSDRRSLAAVAEKIDSLSRRISILELDSTDAEGRGVAADREAETCKSELDLLVSQMTSATDAYKRACAEYESVEKQLHGLENELFGDFAERHGIETIQDFEAQFVQRSEHLREQLLEFEATQTRIVSSLKYQTSTTGADNTMSRLEAKLNGHRAQIARIEESLENLSAKRSELGGRAKAMQDVIKEIVENRKGKDTLLRERRQESGKVKETISKLKGDIAQHRSSLEHLISKRTAILTDCRVSQTHVCVSECSTACTLRSGQTGRGTPTRRRERAVDTDVEMTDQGNENGTEGAENGGLDTMDIVINYARLPSTLQGAANANADVRSEKINEMTERISSISSQLDAMAPNMRAQEHMSDVQERLAEMDREAERARTRAQSATTAYNDVKTKREEAFRRCFDHVANKINDVYKQLTRSPNYPMGGTAYLSLEQQVEPYLGGIKFNAMPPTKRFRDMDQLSGGERTVAALALLFAIHDFRPSPFFVLDEIDAALDNLNVGKVSAYIRSRAVDLQTIVISLKDAFFEKADALLGIYRDVALNASRLLTVDLSEYPDEQQSPAATVAAS